MSKCIGIRRPHKPDIVKLVRRYVTELCLPTDVADYIERLINLLPPQFDSRSLAYYPGYEARAMAYIIFTLKLLYGLDGFKEQRISLAAQKLNNKIEQLNRKTFEKQPLLFVWNEWVEYIEMRKVIVAQFNPAYCVQFKQCQSTEQMLEQMNDEMRKAEERDSMLNDSRKYTSKPGQLRSLFERFMEHHKDTENAKKPGPLIDFKPSFTPSLSYLKNILLLYDNDTTANTPPGLNIPDFMRIDHAKRDINSYLEVRPLVDYFKKHQLKLNVHVVSTTENTNFVGIFRAPRSYKHSSLKVQKACFDVTEEEWAETIREHVAPCTDDLGFKTDLPIYSKSSIHAKVKDSKKNSELFNPLMNYDLTAIIDDIDDEDTNENVS